MEDLERLAHKAVYGPFGPQDAERALHLIGEDIVSSNTEDSLGQYSILLMVHPGENFPYSVELGREIKYQNKRVIQKFRWIAKFDKLP